MTVLDLLQPSLLIALLSLPAFCHSETGSLSFRSDAYERSHAVLALLSEMGRVETGNLT